MTTRASKRTARRLVRLAGTRQRAAQLVSVDVTTIHRWLHGSRLLRGSALALVRRVIKELEESE